MTRVTLYGRPGCHLCDDARDVLVAEGVAFDEVDIEQDDELLKRYLERIPVVTVDGIERFDFFVNAAELREALSERQT